MCYWFLQHLPHLFLHQIFFSSHATTFLYIPTCSSISTLESLTLHLTVFCNSNPIWKNLHFRLPIFSHTTLFISSVVHFHLTFYLGSTPFKKHKNIKKWRKLWEAIRPIHGSPYVNTSAYFHQSSSSINLSNLLLKLPIVWALTIWLFSLFHSSSTLFKTGCFLFLS